MYSYKIEVDWLNTGSWTDITADVRYQEKVRYSRGRDSELGYCVAGSLDFYVNNPTGAYTPGNSAFPTYPDLKLRMPIRLSGYNGVGWVYLWKGYITQITPKPHPSEQKTYIECQDALSIFNRTKVYAPLNLNYFEQTGDIFGRLLDSLGWTGVRALDDGTETYYSSWWYKQYGLAVANQILDCEDGSYASMFFIDHAGAATYHDLLHRYLITTPSHIFDDSEINDISYKVSDRNYYDQIIMTGHTYHSSGTLGVIWGTTNWVEIEDDESVTVMADYGGLGFADTRPRPGVDWTAWDAAIGGTDWTANCVLQVADTAGNLGTADEYIRAYSEGLRMVITNHSGHKVWIRPGSTDVTKALTVRGYMFTDQELTVTSPTGPNSSITLEKDMIFIDNKKIIKDLANYLLYMLDHPSLDQIRVTIKNKTSDLHTQILTRELGECIGITSTKLGISQQFFIEQMNHEFDQFEHTVEYLISQHGVTGSGALYWILGTSVLGTDTIIAPSVLLTVWYLGTSILGTNTRL